MKTACASVGFQSSSTSCTLRLQVTEVGRVGSTHQNIKQQIIFAEESAKSQALFDLIFSEGPQRYVQPS
jgi:hypothetical protein